MASVQDQRHSLLTLRASDVALVHTTLAFTAFGTALVLGCLLHFQKIVKNEVAGYPQEWFPSVSATIGDWYPERNVFQILIALNSGPRFVLVLLQYFLQQKTSSLPLVVLIAGLIRTLSCGGWVYITSSDDHDAHDILMITYIICNVPWMFGGIACTPKEHAVARWRRIAFASAFFVSIIPMVYFFVQHKVHKIPGAYTRYSFFEWGLILTDILFDSATELDFVNAGLVLTVSESRMDNGNKSLFEQDRKFATENQVTLSNTENTTKPDEHNDASVNKDDVGAKKSPPMSVPGVAKRASDIVCSSRPALSFASDLYLAYIFWSIYTSLIPSLFYFSVWELGIAGAELSLLAILSPGLLGIKWFKGFVYTRSGRVFLHILSLLGLVGYDISSPAKRLLLAAFANIFICVGAVVDWSKAVSSSSHSIFLGLGLILSSLTKHANHSNNPVWPTVDEHSGGYNRAGLFLAVLSICELASRAENQEDLNRKDPDQMKKPTVISSTETRVSTWLPPSLALGSLLFSLHCFLTDSSTLIAWTWTGYPIRGPVPHLHGSLTLLAQSAGMLIPMFGSSAIGFLRSPWWFIFGILSSYTFYSYDDWPGYIGGSGFAIFLMSIIPQTLQQAAASPFIGRTYFMSFFTAIILYLANVFTVAYAFVPGGYILRERSDLVLLAQLALLVPVFIWPSNANSSSPKLVLEPRIRAYCLSILCFASIASGLVSMYRTPTNVPQPFRPGPRIIRAGIWTVHFGMDNEGRDSQRAMRDLIQDMELDIIGLLETDLHRPAFGNRDLTRILVEELGYFVDLGPGPNKHTWGAVLLSKFPVINSTHHLLPSPHGELAPAISAFLDVWGTEIMVIVSHNGQEEDPIDRELQSKELARIMDSSYPVPTIFLGYVVTKPHAPRPSPYDILITDGRMYDIDAEDHDRWCEYIMYRGLYRTSYLRMSRGKVTDTELQVGQFVVPPFGQNVEDDSESARYLRIHKETLDVNHWFPMEYYESSGGKNGHFYHVFGTPLYYNLPERAFA